MSAPVVLAIILAVVSVPALLRAHRPDAELVTRWAGERGLPLTPENRPIVERYLRRARLLRAWGAVAGAVLPSLIEYAVSGRVQVLGFGTDGTSAPLGFGTIFVGYLLGALLAEISLGRPVDGAHRTAGLQRRELDSYLPRRVVRAQRATAAAALGTVVIGLVPYADSVSIPRLPSLALVALAIAACAAGLEAVERWVVRRPQPFTSPSLVAADDAIRAQSIHSVAGACLALTLLYCCGIALVLQGSQVGALHTVMVVPALAFLVLSCLACRGIGESTWRVRRARPAGAASA